MRVYILIYLNKTKRMMINILMILMMMMNLMMKIKMARTWIIFKLGAPDFTW